MLGSKEQVDFRRMNADVVRFSDNTFDMVICQSVAWTFEKQSAVATVFSDMQSSFRASLAAVYLSEYPEGIRLRPCHGHV